MLPRVIGHRGAAAVAPENTLVGIRAAAGAGAAWVEFDVRITADGVCVLLHDDTLKRTAGDRRKIAAVTHAEIADLDAGGWFAAQFAGERLPTLGQALEEIARLGLGANVEIKPDPKRAAQVAESVIGALRDRPPDARLPVLVSSLDERMLEAVRRLDPDLPLGLLLRRRRRNWRNLADRLDCVTIHCRQSWLGQRDIDRFRHAGFGVAAFTVNEPAQAISLIRMGVSAVFTDCPAEVLGPVEAMASRGAA